MVTGGYGLLVWPFSVTSAEVYEKSTWSYVASLPSTRGDLSAATVDNSVFLFGEICKFSSQTQLVIVCI